MTPLSNKPADMQQMLSMDSRSLEGLKRGARAERGSEEFNAAVDKVAVQFESIFLQMALKSMRDATPEGGLFTDSSTKTYQGMYDQELVQKLSGKGLGLASEIARQLKAGAGVGGEDFPSTFPKTDR
ncbi:MAG: rod-binding protein [Gammaproteobacteria bacterium]|uniref:rod-binding protein n=1 Tax=Limnobacter sp. TaxID=2003368 RepID=UPI001D647609|nr:rod-binding protein [Gammaproteobacteria bacterium]MBU0848248.1 rod-binding protein [Gammaproteobacteria bacterium]MBU1266942.1 rod-binding protein [Gammaproteobacteria bacterium]MBU1528455.1 rod-binding protein [Gammaproteobacteria bacterium]MBU1779144.1 rod-binding protein [Gammaproteobacteria bacterium]